MRYWEFSESLLQATLNNYARERRNTGAAPKQVCEDMAAIERFFDSQALTHSGMHRNASAPVAIEFIPFTGDVVHTASLPQTTVGT